MIGFLSPGGPVALFVFGFLLVQKRTNANTGVGVVQVFNKVVAFAGQLRCQAAAIGVGQQILDAGQGIGGAGVELLAKLQGLLQCLYGAAAGTGMIFLILLGADILNVFLALTQVNTELAKWVVSMDLSPLAVLFTIIAIYLVLGCVMDSLSMLLLTIPIFFPIIMGIDLWGMDPESKAIWFGILALMVVEIGLITPPVGMNVFIISSMTKDVPMKDIFLYVMPFLASDLLRILLIVFVPSVVLFVLKL
jgi:TRAP-type C4-dicarboxylate transport system permease large subunit